MPAGIPASGQITMYQIAFEMGLSTTNISLRNISSVAGFSSPDAITDFYGYVPTDVTPPSQVTGLTATGNITTNIALEWDAASDNVGVTGYTINWSYDNSTWYLEGTTTLLTYTFTAPDTNTLYYFRVQAYDAENNQGSWSTSASAYSGDIA